jgi:fatty acid-binding protein DegV
VIAIVTDSTAYFSKKEAENIKVRMVPMNYFVDGQVFNEGFRDRNGNFEALISKNSGRCQTSQSPIPAFMSVLRSLRERASTSFAS